MQSLRLRSLPLNVRQAIVLGMMLLGVGWVAYFPPVVEITYDSKLDYIKKIHQVGRPDRASYRDDIKRDILLFIELNNKGKIIFYWDRARQFGEAA